LQVFVALNSVCVADLAFSSLPHLWLPAVATATLMALILWRELIRRTARLRETEDRYRLITGNQTEFVVKWLPDSTRTFVNESYCRYFGVTEESCVGTSFLPLVAPEFREAVERKIASITPDNPVAVDEHLSFVAGGGQRWQEWTDRGEFDADGRLVELLSTGKDITRRKEVEHRLVETRRKKDELRAVLDTFQAEAPVGIAYVNRDCRFIRCNDALAEMNGIPSGEHLGRTVAEVVPDLWPQLEPIYRHVLSGKGPVLNHEVVGQTPARPGQLRYWFVNYFPVVIRDEIIGLAVIVNEVTERRRLEAHLRNSQTLDAVGQLAGGMAHDFNNLLTVINTYTELLLSKLPGDDEGRRIAEQIQSAGEQAAALTRQLLAFSRGTTIKAQVVDVNGLVDEVQLMLRRLLDPGIGLSTMLDPQVKRVLVGPGQLHQILLNLALNARDAMPNSGRLTISTANVEIAEGGAGGGDVIPGEYVLVSVCDTGCGMAPEVQSRIFEPFFTTKSPGKGSGLGLFVVDGIVRQNGGHIRVESTTGLGTEFRIFLRSADR
jgi:two-component system cell cycle sensor histidine kinase/response regulator CckA